jgi:hypothetical protein
MKDLAASWEAREAAAKTALEAARRDNKATQEFEKDLATATETRDILNKMYEKIK